MTASFTSPSAHRVILAFSPPEDVLMATFPAPFCAMKKLDPESAIRRPAPSERFASSSFGPFWR